jgi:hypothetical protein
MYDAMLAQGWGGTYLSSRIKNTIYVLVSGHSYTICIHAVTVSIDTTKDTALPQNLLVIMNILNSPLIM